MVIFIILAYLTDQPRFPILNLIGGPKAHLPLALRTYISKWTWFGIFSYLKCEQMFTKKV